jgi:hypothetical protein
MGPASRDSISQNTGDISFRSLSCDVDELYAGAARQVQVKRAALFQKPPKDEFNAPVTGKFTGKFHKPNCSTHFQDYNQAFSTV